MGAGGFETIFARGVEQCVPAGLVNGRKIHLDGSLVDAHASNDSVCKGPAGQTLTRRQHKKQRQAYEYACAAATCQACPLHPQCTRVQKPAARTIKRHYDQEVIAAAKERSHRPAAKRDRQRRKWRMEGSFGDATTHHGFKRARWRGLWRQQIQDWLIATVQNLRTLVR